MLTNKFIWGSFEKYSDKLFYIDCKTSLSFKQFYEKVIEYSSQKEFNYKKNETVPHTINSSLESLLKLFSIFYNNAIPVLLSSDLSKDRIKELLESINLRKITGSNNATIIFSSGSTSITKAILQSFNNHYYSALGSNENISFTQDDRWLLSLPLHHIGGLSIIFRALLSGGTIVCYDKTIPLEDIIKDHYVTHVSVVAVQLQRMLHDPEKLKSLKVILVGGGYVPEDLIRKAIELKLPIYKTYGMSEMSSQITTTHAYATQQELLTSGKVLNYRELKISDDNEILVRGEVLCKVYLNAEIHIDTGGWFHTGDLGKLNIDSNLTVLGRKDRMFISGGENIYPEPIEKLLLKFDKFSELCIVPKNDNKFGQVPVLFYNSKVNQEITISEIKEFLQDKLLPFEVPKAIYLFPPDYKPLGIKPNYEFLKNWVNR